ncbi:MAG: hypothetical protein ACI4J7_01800 [Ruminiclostridium sp.]
MIIGETNHEWVREVAHYLGLDASDMGYLDEYEFNLIANLVNQAFARLKQATCVDWSKSDNPLVIDAINGLCYLSYYAMRDDAKNTTFLEQFVGSKIFELQMTDESIKARSEQSGG